MNKHFLRIGSNKKVVPNIKGRFKQVVGGAVRMTNSTKPEVHNHQKLIHNMNKGGSLKAKLDLNIEHKPDAIRKTKNVDIPMISKNKGVVKEKPLKFLF